MTSEPFPRIRKAGLPSQPLLVVRGDLLDESVLVADAHRMTRRFPEWPLTDVSAYLAADNDEVDALCKTKLANFAIVVVFRRDALEASGLLIIPTFRTPHVTLAARSPADLVAALREVSHREMRNPYHEPEGQEGDGRVRARSPGRPQWRGRLRSPLGSER